MALADLLKTFKEEDDKLTDQLERYLMYRSGPDIGRPYEERIEGYHHPSALSSIACLRQYVYSWIDAKRSDPSNSAKGQRIFDTGNDFGYRMQGYLYENGILLGKWKCVVCEYEWVDLENPSPRCCPKCAVKLVIWYNLHYLEVPLVDNELEFAGHSDAAVLNKQRRELWEFKTIKNRDSKTGPYAICFEDLVEPQGKHQHQLNTYFFLANKLYGIDAKDFTKGGFIYGAKNTQEWKEFKSMLIPETVEAVKVKAETAKYCINTKTLPERLGTDKTDRFCRYCEWLKLCWSEHTFEEVARNPLCSEHTYKADRTGAD